MTTKAQISIEPLQALITDKRDVRLSGFAPNTVVTVRTQSRWSTGNPWQGKARFLADANGAVDLSTAMPMDGYRWPDALGMVWSMRADSASPAYPPSSPEPISIEWRAEDASGNSAQTTMVQHFIAEGVSRRKVAEDGVHGELFMPAGAGPHPVVIYMNGSSGGISPCMAAVFAANGYACLALGVFNYEGRPKYISDVELEYFENALQWVRRTLQPKAGFVAMAGISRGSEMSLLSASYFPDLVSAVIGYVPTSTINSVASAGKPEEGRDADTWRYQGQFLPNVWKPSKTADWSLAIAQNGEGVRQTPAFVSTLADPEAVARASIPAEKIRCPVLLLSASDDGFWPSTLYSQLLLKKLRGYAKHVDLPDAGHYVFYPGLPTTVINKKHAMSGAEVCAGGTPEANAKANELGHREVLAFLAQAAAGALS